ncbi:MAG: RNA pseudouridine synthase [Lachnospiraceae bacterium]|nr:RNA pseudouridine synthase [Lachnospiraceae bacterium]
MLIDNVDKEDGRVDRYRILYEDEDVLVVYKVAGVAVQSARVMEVDVMSLLRNELMERGVREPYLGLVNRLDQPVEGIFLVGRNKRAAARLSEEVGEHMEMEKWYKAVVVGKLLKKEGRMVDYLLRDGRTNTSKVVKEGTKGSKRGELEYQVVEETDKRSLLRIRLLTGRHHQIRVQLAHAGVPIVGDRKYGMREERGQLCLCASEMVFRHPGTGERMDFRVEPAFLENWKG